MITPNDSRGRGGSIGLNSSRITRRKNIPRSRKLINFYTTHCPQCMVAERLMKEKGIEYNVIEDIEIILHIAEDNGISGAPFAEINGEYLRYPALIDYINSYGRSN